MKSPNFQKIISSFIYKKKIEKKYDVTPTNTKDLLVTVEQKEAPLDSSSGTHGGGGFRIMQVGGQAIHFFFCWHLLRSLIPLNLRLTHGGGILIHLKTFFRCSFANFPTNCQRYAQGSSNPLPFDPLYLSLTY